MTKPKAEDETPVDVRLEIRKLDDEQRLAFGWVTVVEDAAGNPIIDSEGHVIPIVELEKAAHSAFVDGGGGRGKGGDLHETKGALDVVESMVVTAEKRAAFGFGPGPAGWLVGFRVNDPKVWEQVKNGERPELSMLGTGKAAKQ